MPRVQITEIVAGRNSAGFLLGVDGASVQVNDSDGDAATVYQASTGSSTLSNPLTSDNGRIDGWLDEGSYQLVPTVSGVTGDTIYFEARAAYPADATDGQILTWDDATSGVKWSDADSITAGLPWTIDLNVFTTPATQTNWGTIAQSSTLFMGGHRTSTGDQNAEVGWDVVLGAGTWTLSIICRTGADYGIATVSLAGTSAGTIDLYVDPGGDNNSKSITGITVATTGKKRLLFKMATKNASSSSYKGGLQAVSLVRTA